MLPASGTLVIRLSPSKQALTDRLQKAYISARPFDYFGYFS
jgi:hypothetical protein